MDLSTLSFDPITVLLISVICLVLGATAGFTLAYFIVPKQPQEKTSDRRLAEALRVWRHKRSGRLILQLEDQMIDSVGELSLNRHNRLLQLMEELRLWLGASEYNSRLMDVSQSSTQSAKPAEKSLPTQAANPAPAPVQATSPVPVPEPRQPAAPVQSAQPIPVTAAPVKPLISTQPAVDEKKLKVSFNPFVVLARAVNSDTPKDVSAPKSIAVQIDEILQEKLALSPLKDRGIRLMEMPNRGVVVLVGLETYDGVGEVPDPEIQALLKECVAEWENRRGDQALG